MVAMGTEQVRMPRVGEMVQIVSQHPFDYPNGKSDPDQGVAAVVTRVWSPDGPVENSYINATIFPDCGTPITAGSVPHESNPATGMMRYWRWPQ